MSLRSNVSQTSEFLWDILKIVIISLLIIIPIRYFIVQPFFVRGASMEPTYHQGDYLLVDEISYRFSDPERGEVIIFRYPENPSQFYIKRVIGLPGETVIIGNGTVTIVNEEHPEGFELKEDYLPFAGTDDTEEIELREDEYYVLGDNRSASHDSRKWGPLPDDFIIGRVFIRAWPFNQFDIMDVPVYDAPAQ